MFIDALHVTRKSVPKLIKDPVGLIRDIRTIVESHKNDSGEKSVNGKSLCFWPGLKNEKKWTKLKQLKRESQGSARDKKGSASGSPARLVRDALYRCVELVRAVFPCQGGGVSTRGAPSPAWTAPPPAPTAGWTSGTPPPACPWWAGP